MDPFSDDVAATVAGMGEKALLREVRRWLGQVAPPSPFGMGDDCAELPTTGPASRLMTTDSLVLGRHFEGSTPAALAGAKLLNRNLSDIAAMGGVPTQAVLAGLLPRTVRLDWLEAFVRGLADTAARHGVQIVGGDLTETASDLAFNLTLLGSGAHLLYRHGGCLGDWICVTGSLGGSRLGRHLAFEPRLREGQALARLNEGQTPQNKGQTPHRLQNKGQTPHRLAPHRLPVVRACMDISDGLAIDLCALVPEGCSAALDSAAIPLHPDAIRAARASGRTAMWHALHDGEDHELIFLLEPAGEPCWQALVETFARDGLAPLTRIGTIIPSAGAPLIDRSTGAPLDASAGYDHFR